MEQLKKLRDRIDWLDVQIASLLNERMRAADQIGKIKRLNHQEVADQSREKSVLSQVETVVQHPILKMNISNIYKEIMQESRIAQQFFQHLSQPYRRVGIVGLGLMGGSICKAIKTKDPSIEIGTLVQASEDVSPAREGGWIDREHATIEELLENSELIILASPISSIIPLAEKIKEKSGNVDKLVVIDIAGVKEEIVKAYERLSCGRVEFISTHPMAGKEKSGFANSQATLFVNRTWVVVPHGNNTAGGLDSINELIRFLGAQPACLGAGQHDKQAALVSHLPGIISKSYFDFVNSHDPESMKIAGPGFESFTRLAHDNEEMREEIAKYNQQAIRDYLGQWLECLKR